MNYIVTIPAERYEDLSKAVHSINPYAPNPLPANPATTVTNQNDESNRASGHIATSQEPAIDGSGRSNDQALPNAS